MKKNYLRNTAKIDISSQLIDFRQANDNSISQKDGYDINSDINSQHLLVYSNTSAAQNMNITVNNNFSFGDLASLIWESILIREALLLV